MEIGGASRTLPFCHPREPDFRVVKQIFIEIARPLMSHRCSPVVYLEEEFRNRIFFPLSIWLLSKAEGRHFYLASYFARELVLKVLVMGFSDATMHRSTGKAAAHTACYACTFGQAGAAIGAGMRARPPEVLFWKVPLSLSNWSQWFTQRFARILFRQLFCLGSRIIAGKEKKLSVN